VALAKAVFVRKSFLSGYPSFKLKKVSYFFKHFEKAAKIINNQSLWKTARFTFFQVYLVFDNYREAHKTPRFLAKFWLLEIQKQVIKNYKNFLKYDIKNINSVFWSKTKYKMTMALKISNTKNSCIWK
jgi:aspartyl/asparaginyl-tRNA synthetase